MNISKVAKATGLTAKTIRYYESIGLITAPVRSDNGYRSYTEGALRELSMACSPAMRVRRSTIFSCASFFTWALVLCSLR